MAQKGSPTLALSCLVTKGSWSGWLRTQLASFHYAYNVYVYLHKTVFSYFGVVKHLFLFKIIWSFR